MTGQAECGCHVLTGASARQYGALRSGCEIAQDQVAHLLAAQHHPAGATAGVDAAAGEVQSAIARAAFRRLEGVVAKTRGRHAVDVPASRVIYPLDVVGRKEILNQDVAPQVAQASRNKRRKNRCNAL